MLSRVSVTARVVTQLMRVSIKNRWVKLKVSPTNESDDNRLCGNNSIKSVKCDASECPTQSHTNDSESQGKQSVRAIVVGRQRRRLQS